MTKGNTEMKANMPVAAFLALFCTLTPQTLWARPPSVSSPELEVARCIRQASRGNPWLEKTLWGLRDQEAGWAGAEIRNTNGTYDLGVLQVNSSWVPRLATMLGRSEENVRAWLQFDPCFNVETGRWIFVYAIGQTKDFWKAVGLYHSPTDWRQQRYARSVAGHLTKRFGDRLFQTESQHRR